MAILFDSNQYKYSKRGPIDAKALVKTYTDLLDQSTWINNNNEVIAYNGMVTAVWLDKTDSTKNGIYFLFDPSVSSAIKVPNVADEANWHKLVDVSDLASINAKLPVIDELALRAQSLEDTLNGSDEYEGLIAEVAKNTAAIAAVTSMATKIVDEIPSVDEAKPGIIYLVADENASGSYIEYILVDDSGVKSVEQIGSTALDLTGFVTIETLEAELLPYAKTSDVVAASIFDEFRKSNDATLLEVAAEVSNKADIVDLEAYYKIKDADAKFISAEDLATVLNSKADKDVIYTKSEINEIQAALTSQINTKADVATIYTKYEVDAFLDSIKDDSSAAVASVMKDLVAYENKTDAILDSLEARVGTEKTNTASATGLFAKIENTQARVDEVADIISEISANIESANAKLNGISTTVIQAIEDAIQDIPPLAVATEDTLGGIKSSIGANKVSVDKRGIASVDSVNVNSLTQDEDDIRILNGGRCY